MALNRERERGRENESAYVLLKTEQDRSSGYFTCSTITMSGLLTNGMEHFWMVYKKILRPGMSAWRKKKEKMKEKTMLLQVKTTPSY